MKWIRSIYFKKLAVRYRALDRGYLGDTPGRKLRAVLKAIIQSASPCLDQREMRCDTCLLKAACPYRDLMVVDGAKDYLPYVIHFDDPGAWRGPVAAGNEYEFQILLLGQGAEWLNDLGKWIRGKPLIGLNGPGFEKLPLMLIDTRPLCDGRKIVLDDLIEGCRNWPRGSRPEKQQLAIEFLTPFDFTLNQKTLTDPDALTFEIFLEALYRRVVGLGKAHCDASGDAPSFDEMLSENPPISSRRGRHLRFVRKRAVKSLTGGKKDIQYIGGLKSRIFFEGHLAPHLPLILLGEQLHIGRHTTQGLGQYRILWQGA